MPHLIALIVLVLFTFSNQALASPLITTQFESTQKTYRNAGTFRQNRSDAINATRRAAAAYLNELKTQYQLPRHAAFDRGELIAMRDEICVRHQQTYYSRLIYGTRAVLCADPSGNPRQSFATITSGKELENFKQAVMDPGTIKKLAEESLRRSLGEDFGVVQRPFPVTKSIWVENPKAKGVLGAYEVEFRTLRMPIDSEEAPEGRYIAIMNAVTGEMLAYEDRVMHARGIGMVWERDRILTPERVDIELGEFLEEGRLRYAYFEIDTDEPEEEPVYEPEGIFDYPVESPKHDQVQAAYGLQRALGTFLFLGYVPLRSIKVVTRYGDDYANAFYNGSIIALGAGDGVFLNNTAWDSTIVAHEYGHMMIDDYAKIKMIQGLGEGGAVHEGYADYLACIVWPEYGPTLGEGAMPDGEPLRRCDSALTYTDVKGKEGHYAGQALSGAMWEVRGMVGDLPMDTLAIHALARFQPSGLFGTTMMEDTYYALKSADAALYGGANLPALVKVFGDRSFIPTISPTEDDSEGVTGPLAMDFQ